MQIGRNQGFFNVGILIYCVAVCAVFQTVSKGQVPQSPRFGAPNKSDANGNLCSSLRPSRTLACPLYGININKGTATKFIPFSQAEIENACAALNFARCPVGTNLFPDGECRSCPEGFDLRGDGTGFLYCGKEDEKAEVFPNPFNCEGNGLERRNILHVYRPCYGKSNAPKVTLAEYYKRDDYNSELAMAACQKLVSSNISVKTTVTQNKKTRTFDFALIRDNGSEADSGFVQCQRKPQTYSFTSFGWIFSYVLLAAATIILSSYTAYKRGIEAKGINDLKEDQSNLTCDTSIAEEVDTEDLGVKMRQIGYRDDIFGSIAHFTFWGLTWFWNIFFLLVSLDEYGMLIGTLCKSVPFGACGYSWRTGFDCASGCLFSWNWIGGIHTQWPFEPVEGGVAQIYATVFIGGAIVGIWWLGTLMFYSKLKLFFRIRCRIVEASHVVVYKPKEKEVRVEAEENSIVVKLLDKLDSIIGRIAKSSFDMEMCKVKSDAVSKFFVFQCLKYTFDIKTSTYILSRVNIAKTYDEFCKLGEKGLSTSVVNQIRGKVGANQIVYKVPSLGESIWNEFFSLFYVYQFLILWLLLDFFYWSVASVLALVVIFAGVISISVTRESQKKMQRMAEIHGTVSVLRDAKWVEVHSSDLVPGDVIRINSGDEMTSDCVITHGRCVMNENALTGEPTPVPKVSLNGTATEYSNSSEEMKYTVLSGTRVESVSPGTLRDTRCVVLATGAQTRQGELIRSMLYPPKFRFKFDDHFRLVFLFMCALGFVVFLFVGYLQHFQIISIFYGVFSISQLFSPLIPAVFSAGQARCSNTLKKENIFCVELSRTYVAAKIKTFCFDKTGTLTKQGMEYYGFCESLRENGFANVTTKPNAETQRFLGCCHELEFLIQNNEVTYAGNEVDVAMFRSSDYAFKENESDGVVLLTSNDRKDVRIMKRFEFSRDVMMMSVILEDVKTGQEMVFCKGSYEKVVERCRPESIPIDFEQRTSELAMQGHYLLGAAIKPYEASESFSTLQRSSVETDLSFVGLLIFKNDLKSDTSEVLEEMKEGGIRNVLITGDNLFTACAISKESGLSLAKEIIYGDVEVPQGPILWRSFPSKAIVSPIHYLQTALDVSEVDLAITGAALHNLKRMSYEKLAGEGESLGKYPGINGKADAMRFLLPYTRIFARMKPAQKVDVVRLHMERAITGMCGDGANDAAALRIAHCGVAIATGSSSATIVAPFSSSATSINVAAEVVRQGRGALAAAFAGYKRLIMYGQMTLSLKAFLYNFSLQMSEVTWMFIDSIVNVSFSLTILLSQSASRLTPRRPTSKLLGTELFTSLGLQIVILYAMIFGGMDLLFQQNWFACKNFDVSQANLAEWWTMGDNFEAAVLSIIGSFQMINMGFVFNYGFEYRKWWFKNYWLLTLWAIFFAFMAAVLFFPPSFLPCLFRINCGDASLLTRWESLRESGFTDSLFTPFSEFFDNPLAPRGCSCNETIAYSGPLDTCENEYISCAVAHYNQIFHHNYFPYRFRWVLFGVVIGGFVLGIIAEWIVVYGPVRRLLRKRKQQKKLQKRKKEELLFLHGSVQ